MHERASPAGEGSFFSGGQPSLRRSKRPGRADQAGEGGETDAFSASWTSETIVCLFAPILVRC
jgi:hypothetical protein